MTILHGRLVQTVPGPNQVPGIGRLTAIIRFIHNSLEHAHQLFRTYGPVVLLAPAGRTKLYAPLPYCPGTVAAYGPEIVREVTSQHDIYYKQPMTMGLVQQAGISAREAPLGHLGVGLFGVNSDTHRAHRRLIMPAFHKKRIETYAHSMIEIAQEELDQWRDGEQRDVAVAMRNITMRVAVQTLLGGDIDPQATQQVAQLMVDTFTMLGLPLVHLIRRDYPGLPYHRFLNLVGDFDRAIRAVVATKRAHGGDSGDVLSMLMQARDAETGTTLTDDELLGHAGVIFAAGHETSANALSWTLLLLSQHPQIASDLLDELDGVLHGAAPTIEQLARLPFLEHVIKESMRLIPPAPWNGRVTAQPTELVGYALPAGTEVFVSIYETHHMPELYAQPNVFDPRRWETITPTVYEYNPFSAGPRMCIGATFAMLEMKIVLAMLLQRYRLECLPKLHVNVGGLIVLLPEPGLPMIVHAQDRQVHRGVGGLQGSIRQVVELPT